MSGYTYLVAIRIQIIATDLLRFTSVNDPAYPELQEIVELCDNLIPHDGGDV